MIREALSYGIMWASRQCEGVVEEEIAKGFLSEEEADTIAASVFMSPHLQSLIPSVISQEIGEVLSEREILPNCKLGRVSRKFRNVWVRQSVLRLLNVKSPCEGRVSAVRPRPTKRASRVKLLKLLNLKHLKKRPKTIDIMH